MTELDVTITRLGVAALGGLAVGLEREWSGHAEGPHARFAGIRTFMLLGGTGGIVGCLADSQMMALAVALLLGVSALIVAAYFAAARAGGPAIEGTTEVAALLVVALGALAGLGLLEIASGSTAVVVLALSEKERLRRMVERLGETELRAALQFAVLALVVLPLLPNASYGPLGGFQPRSLWMVVLLFSGLNFAGYIAHKMVGARHGQIVAGLLGGTFSSTAVTLHFARRSTREKALGPSLGVGVIAACTVLPIRVTVVSLALNPAVALAAIPYLVAPFLAGVAFAAYFLWRQPRQVAKASEDREVRSPLGLWSALKMALAFQAVLMALTWARSQFNEPGVHVSAVLFGLTDMDALTVSMNRLGNTAELVPLAAQAIAIGVLTNTLFKLSAAAILGATPFRKIALPGLALLSAAMGLALWIGA